MGNTENTRMRRSAQMQKETAAVSPEYGYAWPYREDVGTPELVVRVAGAFGEWLRAVDGCRSHAPVIITILP